MKVSLHFELPQDNDEFFQCISGENYSSAFSELDEELRRVHKYNSTFLIDLISDEYPDVVNDEKVREIFEHLAFKLRGAISDIKDEAGVL